MLQGHRVVVLDTGRKPIRNAIGLAFAIAAAALPRTVMNSRRLRSSMRLPPQGATVIIRPPAAVLAQSVCRTSSLPMEVSTVFGADLNSESRPVPPELHATRLRCNPNVGIRKHGRERSAARCP